LMLSPLRIVHGLAMIIEKLRYGVEIIYNSPRVRLRILVKNFV
jgi:hypothetical protein